MRFMHEKSYICHSFLGMVAPYLNDIRTETAPAPKPTEQQDSTIAHTTLMQKAADTHSNTSVRQRVIEYSTQLFFEKGIRDVTMDAISQGLKMSKRTLYQLFADKEQLIIACIEAGLARSRKKIWKMVEEKRDIIEIILTHIDTRLSLLEKMSQKYVYDIDHYPSVKAYFEQFKQEFYTEGVSFLKQGVEEGCLRDDINLDIAIRYAFHNNKGITKSQDFAGFSLKEVFLNTCFIYFRGCCTKKGLEVLDNYYSTYKNRQKETID